MSQTVTVDSVKRSQLSSTAPAQWTPTSDVFDMEDASPFGLQGLTRQTIQILKPEFITRLAINLSLRATRKQIRDPEYVNRVISWHPEWVEEFQIVHLIEKSLWIRGQSDLVMTMTRNPSQIPDNPPEKVKQALSRAYALHPDATIWYGVPLFSDVKNEEGLPIPVTASEVRAEAQQRIEAAQQNALRWGWMYRAALTISRFPTICWQYGVAVRDRLRATKDGAVRYWSKCRQDARNRARAIYTAEFERCRFGSSNTEIPEHRTWLGQSLETACVAFELMAYQASVAAKVSPFFGLIAAPLAFAQFVPMLMVPMTIVSCDPFLFVELPEEPGKLRHIGHWYWQQQNQGQDKLHLHV